MTSQGLVIAISRNRKFIPVLNRERRPLTAPRSNKIRVLERGRYQQGHHSQDEDLELAEDMPSLEKPPLISNARRHMLQAADRCACEIDCGSIAYFVGTVQVGKDIYVLLVLACLASLAMPCSPRWRRPISDVPLG